jgi:acetyl esterase/lipase
VPPSKIDADEVISGAIAQHRAEPVSKELATANTFAVAPSSTDEQRNVVVTMQTAPIAAARPDPVSVVSGVASLLNTVLSPFAATTAPSAPAQTPALWTLLAFARREFEQTFRSPTVNPVAAQITNGLVTDTSTFDGQSIDPAITGNSGAPTPGLSDLTVNAQLNNTAAEDPWTGEPSIVSQVFTGIYRVLGVVGKLFGAPSAITFGASPRFLGSLLTSDSPPWFTTLGLNVQRGEFEGMPVWTLQSPGTSSGKVVVGFHGGGYIYRPAVTEWLDFAVMAHDTGATVVVPIYPLAPQGTADTVVPQMADFVSSEIDQHGSENVSAYGDSAGGGLALLAVQELVRRGEPVPSHMVLISPWLDASVSDPASQTIDDPVANYAELKGVGLLWAGDLDPADPRVSPLFGSLEGLPPIAVYSGSLELLSPQTLRLRERALAEGADITFVLRKGEVHVWATLPFLLPEAHAVRPDIYQQLGIAA